MLVESLILLERIKHTSMKLDNSIQDIDKHFRSTHTRTHNVVWLFGSLFCALICMRTIECLSVSSIAIGCFIVVVSTFPHTMLYLSLEANKENVRQSASHIWLRNKHMVRMLLLWIVVDCSHAMFAHNRVKQMCNKFQPRCYCYTMVWCYFINYFICNANFHRPTCMLRVYIMQFAPKLPKS